MTTEAPPTVCPRCQTRLFRNRVGLECITHGEQWAEPQGHERTVSHDVGPEGKRMRPSSTPSPAWTDEERAAWRREEQPVAMPATPETNAPPSDLYDLAKRCLETVGGNLEEFESRFRWMLRKERAKYFDSVIDWAVPEMRRELQLRERTAIAGAQMPRQGKDRGAASLAYEAEKLYQKWLDFKLSDGTPLAKATWRQVEAQRDIWRVQGRTVMARADWFDALLARRGTAETVGEALDAKAVYELAQEAKAKWAEA